MRTCPKCGCYIPDNWTICPACNTRKKEEIKTEWNPLEITAQQVEEKLYKDDVVTIYRLMALYDYKRVKMCYYQRQQNYFYNQILTF